MNITFFIGNGFDINLGLHTKYTDFYKYLIEKEPNNSIVKNIQCNSELWADFEIGLGKYLEKVNTDEEIERFFDDKESIENHLQQYLKMQNSCVSYPNEKKSAESFRNGIVNFYKAFSPKEQQHYNIRVANADNILYQFIDFNYTFAVDSLVSLAQKHCKPFSQHIYNTYKRDDIVKTPLHIHGDLNGGMIIGINDESQINNEKLKNNPAILNYLLKKQLNDDIGYFRIRDAQQVIDNSMYICVYGMSIGDTDNMWWQSIIKWLTQSDLRRLVLFVKDSSVVSTSAGAQLRYDDKKRKIFIEHGIDVTDELYKKIHKQIIIITNSKIFDIEGLVVKQSENTAATKNNDVHKLIGKETVETVKQNLAIVSEISTQKQAKENKISKKRANG